MSVGIEQIEPMAQLLFGALAPASGAIGTALDPEHEGRVDRESLARLLSSVEGR